MLNSVKGLYVHIPFCSVKCRFCDFAAFPGLLKQIPEYLDVLTQEMAFYHGEKIDTIFFGGGTPSILSVSDWQNLMQQIKQNFALSENCEISLECNPETVSTEKLKVWRKNGINRLSFGLQSTQNQLLKMLGRMHSFETFLDAFNNARKQGYANINVDLMFGLPQQTMQHWQQTLQQVVDLSPEHLSCYALYVEEKTAFHFQNVEPDDALQAEMYEQASAFLGDGGFNHYEISNFAKAGFECAHNLKYWRNQDCLGVGVSASAYVGGVRQKNTEKFTDYLQTINQKKSAVVEKYSLNKIQQAGENFMLGLRLKEGAVYSDFVQQNYGAALQKFIKRGWLIIKNDRAHLTLQGWLFSNQIFVELI